MAEIIGGLAMSHAPQLMLTPEQWGLLNTRSWDPLPPRPELESETLEVKWAKWKRCMAAINQLRQKLAALAPDTIVVVGDDQPDVWTLGARAPRRADSIDQDSDRRRQEGICDPKFDPAEL